MKKCVDKMVEKISKKTERVTSLRSLKEIFNTMLSLKKRYLMHKYQIYNDTFHWPRILSTEGEIYHMDFSENLTQSYKYEPQSSHFNKKQYSLYCTVKHGTPNQYMYHLSDEMKHDYAFTSTVVDQLIENQSSRLLRFKSDNCSVQYKCKNIFFYWQSVAIQYERSVITYYGVSGHGKGLVDSMSSFGVKGPLRKVVVTGDFSYNKAEDIFHFLSSKFESDDSKNYFMIDPSEVAERRGKPILKIKGCMKYHHMISYHPDGSVQAKINICSCDVCTEGNFIHCPYEKGTIVCVGDEEYDNESSDD